MEGDLYSVRSSYRGVDIKNPSNNRQNNVDRTDLRKREAPFETHGKEKLQKFMYQYAKDEEIPVRASLRYSVKGESL